MNKIYNNILIFLIIIALIFSIIIAFGRYKMEKDFQTIETAMSLTKVRELALKEGIDEYELLKELKNLGLGSIAIQEDSIETLLLQGQIAFWDANEQIKLNWLSENDLGERPHILSGEYILICPEHSLFQRIRDNLQIYLGRNQVQELLSRNGYDILIIRGDKEELLKLGLGFSLEDIRKVQSLDFDIILRPKNPPRIRTDIIQFKLSAMQNMDNVSMIIFDEEEVLGYPSYEHIMLTLKFLQENKFPFGIIEFSSQKGMAIIASGLSKQAVRVHSITKEEIEKISQNRAIERWIRAAQERNIRLFYLNPFLQVRDGSFVLTNLDYLNRIRQELWRNGFSLGKASLFNDYQIPLIYIYIIGMGIIAGGIILLTDFFYVPNRYKALLLVIGFGGMLIINFLINKILLMKIMALAGALIFPTLAIIKNKEYLIIPYSIVKSKKNNSPYGIKLFLEIEKRIIFGITGIMFFSLLGGLFVGALLTHYQFILAINLFSGIKISYLVPLLLVAFHLWLKDDAEKKVISAELKKPILMEHALLVFLLLVFVVVYISRSGNFSFLPVPGWEEKMRLFLEQLLVARPRSKEFLIGYPLLALAITFNTLGIKYLKHIIIIMGTVAPVTVLNTFCHVHTPIYFSILRTFHGYWLGLLIGGFLAALFYLIEKRYFPGNMEGQRK